MGHQLIESTNDTKSAAGKTRIADAGGVRLLMRDDGFMPHAFDQHKWRSEKEGSDDRMLIDTVKFCKANPKKHIPSDGIYHLPRTIWSSGCGLCSIVSYLGAANLLAPDYDAREKRFSLSLRCKPLDPGTFHRYILNQLDKTAKSSDQRKQLINDVFADQNSGVFKYSSSTLLDWINELINLHGVQLQQPFSFGEAIDRPADSGRDIPKLNAHLEQGEPALVGVNLVKGSVTKHQVLVVGYAKVGESTYYPLLDSGWCINNATMLARMKKPISTAQIRLHSITPARFSPSTDPDSPFSTPGYAQITWLRLLSGLQPLTNLKLRDDWK